MTTTAGVSIKPKKIVVQILLKKLNVTFIRNSYVNINLAQEDFGMLSNQYSLRDPNHPLISRQI